MLYERWLQIAQAHPREVALRDLLTGRQWTFAELDASAQQERAGDGPIAFPQSRGPEFVIAVLQAWRRNQVVCPLEPGQAAPSFSAELPKEIRHIKLTSATTGSSRLVAFTQAQLIADAENIVSTMELRPDWPNLGVISLAHSYGFSNLVLPLLLHGIPLLLLDTVLPDPVRRAALALPNVTLAAVPALFRAWHDAGALVPNIRLAISAGAPLPLTLEQSIFAQHNLKIHNFYGSTECGGIAYDRTTVPRQEANCVGVPLSNVPLSIGADGCLQVRGPAVGQTYWPEPSPALNAGTFTTSDVADLVQGSVYLRGRAGDQINIAGRKVCPETIEAALLTHPQVNQCLVFGVPSLDADRVEEIVAYVVSRGPLARETLQQFLLTRIAGWQVPREWRFVESLAANGRGKLSRAEWRKTFLASYGPVARSPSTAVL